MSTFGIENSHQCTEQLLIPFNHNQLQELQTEILSDNDYVVMEEYFETDVKSEVDSDVELDRSPA